MYSLKSGRLSNDRLSIIETDAMAIKKYMIRVHIRSDKNERLEARAKINKLNQNKISPK